MSMATNVPAPPSPPPTERSAVHLSSQISAPPPLPLKPLNNPLKPEQLESTMILTLIRAAITIPIILIWIVVGLYIWIPLLARRILSYIGAIVAAAITRNTDAVVSAGINLEHSTSFFFDGFVLIAHSLGMTGRHLDEQSDKGHLRAKEECLISTGIWALFAIIWLIVVLINKL